MSATADEPTLRATAESPLHSGEPERFDLAEMATATDRVNRRQGIALYAVSLGAVAVWVFLGVGYVQSGYLYTGTFIVLSALVGLLVATGGVGGFLLRSRRNPVAVVVGPKVVTLEYPNGPTWTGAWNDPRLHIVLVDQRTAGNPRVPQFSDFSAWFIGSRWIRGGYVPLTEGAYDRILARARELELPITSHNVTYRGRIPFSRGTVAHRIRGPPSKKWTRGR